MSDPRIDRIAARWSAAQTVARVTVDDLLADLPDDTYTNVVALFPDWTAGETVAVGAVRVFDGNLWRVVQATQAAVDAIVAIPAASRTNAQKLDLGYQRQMLALQRATKDTQQLSKKLVRDIVVTSRYGLFLDGSRVRPGDLNRSE